MFNLKNLAKSKGPFRNVWDTPFFICIKSIPSYHYTGHTNSVRVENTRGKASAIYNGNNVQSSKEVTKSQAFLLVILAHIYAHIDDTFLENGRNDVYGLTEYGKNTLRNIAKLDDY